MALELPNIPKIFKQRFSDGEVNVVNRILYQSSTTPILDEGQFIIWERGLGIYDDYNSVIDPTLWTTGTGGFAGYTTIAETDAYIYGAIDETGGGAAIVSYYLQTADLPAIEDMNDIEFRCDAKITELNTATTSMKLTILGYQAFNLSGVGQNDSVWRAIKNPDDTWNIYDDGVLVSGGFVATTNIIRIENELNYGIGANNTLYTRLYEITVDGGTYLLTKTESGNYRILLKKY